MVRALLAFALAQIALLAQQTQPRAGVCEGKVGVRTVIGTDGIPSDPEVVSSFSPEADKNALDAVRRWRFQPATRGGKPIPIVAVIGITLCTCSDCPRSVDPVITQQIGSQVAALDPGGRALLRWYLKAATGGDVDAQVEVAKRLSSKKEGSYDPVRAYAWATIAALQGSKQAESLRKRLVKRISPAQAQAAGTLAAIWQPGSPVQLADDRESQNHP